MQCDAKSLLTVLRSREALRQRPLRDRLWPSRPRRLRVLATKKERDFGIDVLVLEDDVDCTTDVDGADTKCVMRRRRKYVVGVEAYCDASPRLKVGDRILSANGTPSIGGPIGDTVVLEVLRSRSCYLAMLSLGFD